ncbi:hypothetical protein [Xanthomonas campestris]|uniref:hypothetical protein n=1 Tax=Xanthomonas campestris TaxID=339 RepID=UPI0012901E27|nr:hypothetical protein [Xanthomonas campestris]
MNAIATPNRYVRLTNTRSIDARINDLIREQSEAALKEPEVAVAAGQRLVHWLTKGEKSHLLASALAGLAVLTSGTANARPSPSTSTIFFQAPVMDSDACLIESDQDLEMWQDLDSPDFDALYADVGAYAEAAVASLRSRPFEEQEAVAWAHNLIASQTD